MNNIFLKPLETEDEIRQKAEVNLKGWQEAYTGILEPDFLKNLSAERNLKNAYQWRENTIIAKDGDRVIGFVVCGPCRDQDLPDAGEVYAIYILKEYYGQKIGYRLMLAALDRLNVYEKIAVWVLKDNTRAIRFYQHCGFVFDGKTNVLPLGKPVMDLRMMRSA